MVLQETGKTKKMSTVIIKCGYNSFLKSLQDSSCKVARLTFSAEANPVGARGARILAKEGVHGRMANSSNPGGSLGF